MFSSALKSFVTLFKEYQPAAITMSFVHSFGWLVNLNKDFYPNPKFKPQSENDPGCGMFCVHGLWDRGHAFGNVVGKIKDLLPETISKIYLVSFKRRGVHIAEYAHQLVEKIKESGHKEVVLFGHSRGALICAYLQAYLAEAAGIKVKAVFIFSPPAHGSKWAVWPFTWISPSVEEMQFDSALLAELRKKVSESIKSTGIPYVPYAAKLDSLVGRQSARISGRSFPVRMVERHGHISILSSGKMATHVVSDLDLLCDPNFDPGKLSAVATSADLLEQACDDIRYEINELKQRPHLLFSALKKIEVLEHLIQLLKGLVTDPNLNPYPEAKTIGTVIKAYLEDVSQNPKRIDILKRQLNGAYSSWSKASSLLAIEQIMANYLDVEMPVVTREIDHTIRP